MRVITKGNEVMVTNQRLSERLTTVSEEYGPEDEIWKQFVRDHKKWLQQNSNLRSYTPEFMVQYRYRPEDFVILNEGDPSMCWIFLFINDLRSQSDFNEARTRYYVFGRDLIRQLKTAYVGSASFIPDEREID